MNIRRFNFARFPWVTLCILIAGAMASLSDAGPLLEFQPRYPAVNLYTILTCHLAHWSSSHLIWSLGTFVVLGGLCENRDRSAFALCLFLSASLIPPLIAAVQPALASYRGMSGIDSALFMLLACDVIVANWQTRRGISLMAMSLVAMFCLKISYEQARRAAVFVDSAAAGFVPVPLAHLIGAAVGALVAIVPHYNVERQAAWAACR